jgi:hypothetical protein
MEVVCRIAFQQNPKERKWEKLAPIFARERQQLKAIPTKDFCQSGGRNWIAFNDFAVVFALPAARLAGVRYLSM